MPAVGTFLEPWYTARGTYKWNHGDEMGAAGAAADHCPDTSPLLFGDVTGNGRDDLIRTGLIVGCVNDFAEANSWFPARCPRCQTGEQEDPRLFWDATLAGLALVRQKCASAIGGSE